MTSSAVDRRVPAERPSSTADPTRLLGGPLERGGATPMTEQIQHRIRAAIDDGRLARHQRLPSERDLAAAFGVSRLTTHQALTRLAIQGVLYTRRSQGTFVADEKIHQPLRRLTGFTDDVLARGQRPSNLVIEQALVPAPMELSALFGIPAGSELVRIRRVRLADDEPLAVETTHLVHALCPNLLGRDLATTSLYRVLRDDYGLLLASARQSIEADQPTADERNLLRLPPDVPVLRTARMTMTSDGRVVEFVRAAFRGDRYQMTVELG